MPSLSTTVAKVLEICNSPSASANDLNRLISYDPVLTGQILKLINSAYYGLPNRVTSLTRAIVMLGVNTVKNLVLATSVLTGCKGFNGIRYLNVNDFWAHSLCVGVLAKLIAAEGQIAATEREEYFISGLLHDLGKLPLMACFPEQYVLVLDMSRSENIQLVEAENKLIGFNHCQAGQMIATRWKLGSAVTEAINAHHCPEQSAMPGFLINGVSLANHLANHFRIGFSGDRPSDPAEFHQLSGRMEISLNMLGELRPKMEKELDKARTFLQVLK